MFKRTFFLSITQPRKGTILLQVLPSILLIVLMTACQTTPSEPQRKSASKIIDSIQNANRMASPISTGHPLVDRIGEIKSAPYRIIEYMEGEDSLGLPRDREVWYCGDSLYWEVVMLGEEVLPNLIEKIRDRSVTNIQIPCREYDLTVGGLAMMLLDEIISIPSAYIFSVEWDFLEINCDFGFPSGFLEYIMIYPDQASGEISQWYKQYKSTMQKRERVSRLQSDCHRAFGIDYELFNELQDSMTITP